MGHEEVACTSVISTLATTWRIIWSLFTCHANNKLFIISNRPRRKFVESYGHSRKPRKILPLIGDAHYHTSARYNAWFNVLAGRLIIRSVPERSKDGGKNIKKNSRPSAFGGREFRPLRPGTCPAPNWIRIGSREIRFSANSSDPLSLCDYKFGKLVCCSCKYEKLCEIGVRLFRGRRLCLCSVKE